MVCKASFVVKCCYISYIRFLEMGRIAQVVEQLTLNQRVQGSSPCAPTNLFKGLERSDETLWPSFLTI